MLRISDIKLGTDDTESDLRKKVLKLLGVKNVKSFEISKVTLWPFFIKISEISTNTISPRKSHFYHYIQ